MYRQQEELLEHFIAKLNDVLTPRESCEIGVDGLDDALNSSAPSGSRGNFGPKRMALVAGRRLATQSTQLPTAQTC